MPGKSWPSEREGRVLRGEYGGFAAFDTAQKGCLNINCEYVEERERERKIESEKRNKCANLEMQATCRPQRRVWGKTREREKR